MPGGYCLWPSWTFVYMCFKINTDFLPFGLFLSGVSSLLMIRIIVAVMNVLIKRKFCHTTLWGKREPLQLQMLGLGTRRGKCEIVKKRWSSGWGKSSQGSHSPPLYIPGHSPTQHKEKSHLCVEWGCPLFIFFVWGWRELVPFGPEP